MTVVSSRGCLAPRIRRRHCRPIKGCGGSPPCSAPNPAHRPDPGAFRLLSRRGPFRRPGGGRCPGDGPDEVGHLTGDRRYDHHLYLPGCNKMAGTLAHPQLAFPGDVTNRQRQRLDPGKQLRADARLHAVAPGAAGQRAPGKTASRPDDPAPPHAGAAGMLRRRQAHQAIGCPRVSNRRKSPTPAPTVPATVNPTPRIA